MGLERHPTKEILPKGYKKEKRGEKKNAIKAPQVNNDF